MKSRCIPIATVLIALLIDPGNPACAQVMSRPTEPELEKLVVFIRDAKDGSLLRKEVNVEPHVFTRDGKRSTDKITGTTADGVIIIGLGGGSYDLAFQAEGYHPLLVKDCMVRSTTAYGQMITFVRKDLSFRGEVFTYTVMLEPTDGKGPAGREPEWRYQPFLSDTTYYEMPQTMPQLLGGERTLKEKLTPERLGGEVHPQARRSSVYAVVRLEKDGSVAKVETQGTAPHDVQKKVGQALRDVRFTPAKILGSPVRSQLYIPFEFALNWKQKE